MDKKILFVDLDGTLLNDRKEITPENLAAIEKATALGHAIVVSTGRHISSAIKQVQRLGLNKPGCYAITSNGALLCNTYTQETVFSTGIPKELVRPILDEAYSFGIHGQTYTAECTVCEKDNRECKFYEKHTLMPYKVVPDVTQVLTEDPVKILFIDLDSKQKLEDFRTHMKPYCDSHGIDMFFSCDYYLEFLPHGINKGSGVRYLSKLLGVPIENTIAAGDAENDITMLEAAGTACVMKNAAPEMASYADYITKRDNNHSGIAEVIERFLL